MLTVYCDGGSRGNPGPAASAFVVLRDGKMISSGSKFLGTNTNNFAEYNGVILALEYLKTNKVSEEIQFVLDSELVTKQLTGVYKIKNETLRALAMIAKKTEVEIPGHISYSWSPREKNKEADRLVNEELDRNKLAGSR